MSARSCSVAGCERPFRAKGWCGLHYMKARKYGDPLAGSLRIVESRADAIRRRSSIDGECLVWTGYANARGYGYIRSQGKLKRVHRVAWELANGPIPSGMQVDHTCWNRRCVNVSHLRLATPTENARSLSGAQSNNSITGIRNVYEESGGYLVQIFTGGRAIRCGKFSTLSEAEVVAEQKRREFFGEFAGRG